EEEGWKITGIVLNLTLGIFVILSALVFAFSLPISRLIAPGFAEAEILLMSRLTRILIFSQGFFVISFFLTGALKSYQRFVVPALAPVLYNLGIIGATLLFARSWGIYAPVWGAVIGAFLHFGVQVPLSIRLGFRPVWSLNLNHPGVKRIIRLAAPRLAEIGFLQILKTSEVIFASLISTASFTYLTFARSLEMIPVSLFGLSLADAALPALSRRGRNFKKTFFSVFRQILFLTLPMAVAFAVLRIPLVRLAFGASRFTWPSTVETGYTLSMFALGVIGQALTLHFVRAFYALQDTDTPVVVGIADVILNVALYAYFAIVLQLPTWGLALAFAISALAQAAVLGVLLIRKAKLALKEFVIPGLKTGSAALASGSVMYFLLKVL
ncbi:MAG: lipid II flippase MurJ, partial [bacterium]|nr:lipid II flippase MurJ [bacterium]